MRFCKNFEPAVSEELKAFMEAMFRTGGGVRFQIQDVQESLDRGSPLDVEATRLRAEHGNFYIRND
jgi:hypothetical protein